MTKLEHALMRLSVPGTTGRSSAVVRLAAPRNAALMRLVALRGLDAPAALRAYGRKTALLRLAAESARAAPGPVAGPLDAEINVENESVTR